MHTNATDALYNGAIIILRNQLNGRVFSIRRHKNGHTIPAIWVYEADGKLSTVFNGGHNGVFMARAEVQAWVNDCELVAIVQES